MESTQGTLLNHLPAIYRSSDDLKELLRVFEEILFGLKPVAREVADNKEFVGLVPLMEAMPELANPYFEWTALVSAEESKGFLEWLSEWVAISHPHLFDDEQLRKLVANAVPLYSTRGTKEYLFSMLSFLGIEKYNIEIDDQGLPVFTIGESSIGVDSRLGDLPFLFRVRIKVDFAKNSSNERKRFKHRVHSVIELAKPAHTLFELEFLEREQSKR